MATTTKKTAVAKKTVGRAHRHRRLVDDQRRTLHVLTDLAGHGQHVTQVGRAVLVRGGAHGDAEDVGLTHGLGQRGGEAQGAGIGVAGDDGIEPRLVDGHFTALEPLDALLADVHTNDPVAIPSCLERDFNFPPLAELVDEGGTLDRMQREASAGS